MSGTENDGSSERGGPEPGFPEELWELDRTLDVIRFRPHPALGERIVARSRGEGGSGSGGRMPGAGRVVVAAVGALAIAGLLWLTGLRPGARSPEFASPATIVLDRCCVDLDGGGVADDGIRVIARADETVVEVTIYEDRDGDGRFSTGDAARFAPGTTGNARGPLPTGAITLDLCCGDYDGGGPADDGLFLINVPPDRILLTALYEDRDGSGHASAADRVRYLQP